LNQAKTIAITILLMLITLTAFAKEGKVQIVWPSAVDAVMYELEIARAPVKINTSAPQDQVVYTTTTIYTPGVELSLDLFKDYELNKLYYRVRPLDLDKKPVGNFSRPVALDKMILNPIKPMPTAKFKYSPAPLYPVYSWIPVLEAEGYEIEVTNHKPENPNGNLPSRYRVRSYNIEKGFDLYDLKAFNEDGNYYWRVIALDSARQPIGVYSDAIAFKVQKRGYKWAAFGDSITHGGGAISNPPSDPRFNYFYYLPFSVKNLGRSGDTAAMLVGRFEQDVLPFKPKYLLILGGTNSIREGSRAEDVIASLTVIKEKCLENGIRPIFLTVPPLNPERMQRVFNQSPAEKWQQELAKVNNFLKTQPDVIDIYSVLADEKGFLPVKYSQDGLHPDIAGKKVMGNCIKNYLKTYNIQ